MSEHDDKVVHFPRGRQSRKDTPSERAAAAVARAGPIPREEGSDAPEERRPNRAAVGSFLILAVVALVIAALYPEAPQGAIRWQAAFAFVVAVLMAIAAALHQFVRDFWR